MYAGNVTSRRTVLYMNIIIMQSSVCSCLSVTDVSTVCRYSELKRSYGMREGLKQLQSIGIYTHRRKPYIYANAGTQFSSAGRAQCASRQAAPIIIVVSFSAIRVSLNWDSSVNNTVSPSSVIVTS